MLRLDDNGTIRFMGQGHIGRRTDPRGDIVDRLVEPWNNWFHCTCHTYGAWLRGDRLGRRARNHREHVDGDYRKPPPRGMYDEMLEQSKRLMKRLPVHIVERELRQFIVNTFVKHLQAQGAEVLCASFDDHHLHVLARFPDRRPRIHMGWAKYHTTKATKAHGLAVGLGLNLGQGIWAKGSGRKPIRDRAHQIQVFRYILAHGTRGAAIWRLDRRT